MEKRYPTWRLSLIGGKTVRALFDFDRCLDSGAIEEVARHHSPTMSDRTRTTLEEVKGLGSLDDLPLQTSRDLQLNGARTVLPITRNGSCGQSAT